MTTHRTSHRDKARGKKSRTWLALTATAAAAALWHAASTQRHRRELLARGELQALRSVWATVDDVRIHARVASPKVVNNTLPVILVHGLGVSGAYFTPTAERLAVDFTVYVPDLPGHGLSDTPKAPLDVPGLTHALVRWMDAMGMNRAIMVGHSMGCQVVIDAACRYSSRVERLVLIGPTGDPEHQTIHAQLPRALLACTFERPSLVKFIVKDYLRMGARLWPEVLAMVNDPVEEKLSCVRQPVLLVRGSRDAIAPQRWVDEVARQLATERIHVIPGWGHNVNYSVPEPLVSAIRPFLRGAL